MWEKIKDEEKRERAARRQEPQETPSLLDSVPNGLPGLARAMRLQAKASTVGFDWNDPKAVLAKIREETAEIEAELDRSKQDPARIADEIGDLLFAVANLARHQAVDPDQALQRTNVKFMRRFAVIEQTLAHAGRSLEEAGLDEMEAIWQESKVSE